MCIEPVVAGTQSCQNHLAGPVKKLVCILLLSGFQRCFDDGGLFLVMDAGCSSCTLHLDSRSACYLINPALYVINPVSLIEHWWFNKRLLRALWEDRLNCQISPFVKYRPNQRYSKIFNRTVAWSRHLQTGSDIQGRTSPPSLISTPDSTRMWYTGQYNRWISWYSNPYCMLLQMPWYLHFPIPCYYQHYFVCYVLLHNSLLCYGLHVNH